MRTLRQGYAGEDVSRWQFFLRGLELYFGEVDGQFGPRTSAATANFQRQHGLDDDGIAGNRTIGQAMRLGFELLSDDATTEDSANFPAPPAFGPLGQAGREALFGKYPFEPAPVAANPEAIRITSGWQAENIVAVIIPQLSRIEGAPASGKVFFHRLVADRAKELFERWEQAGLLPHVLTYAGSFVPRFVRGSRSVLSPHAHGSAFDINAAWNGFGKQPALVGQRGSVRKLVSLANELGFYWGGHFAHRDGMHFELARL
jgi:D-alanyl-D-alanine carboxypeptidase/Putative peptidoglycan binding domain